MIYADLITLASLFGAHVGRTDKTVAKRCGVHSRLFDRLKAGHGCRVDTYNAALQSFSDLWPDDLNWPSGIARPRRHNSSKKTRKEAA